MPSEWHDHTLRFFEEHPAFAGRILRDYMGVNLPTDVEVKVVPGTVNTRPSDDLLPDKVITLGDPADPIRIVVVEAQQKDEGHKHKQWARYAAGLWLRHKCPVDILVICPDQKTASMCAKPHETNLERYVHWPKVLMPSLGARAHNSRTDGRRPGHRGLLAGLPRQGQGSHRRFRRWHRFPGTRTRR
jgi:hypothetical protein